MRLFSNRSQRTSKCGKNISDTLGCASYATFLFLSNFDVICDLLLKRCTQLGIYLLNSSCQYQNQQISLENKRSLKQSLRLKKKFSSFFRYRNIRNILIITVIWLSVKYQNFFSFRNVTSPPHAVNVPFISSHRKVSRSSLEPNLSTWEFYFPCGLF